MVSQLQVCRLIFRVQCKLGGPKLSSAAGGISGPGASGAALGAGATSSPAKQNPALQRPTISTDLSSLSEALCKAATDLFRQLLQVIAEDVGAAVLHYGQAPDPALPCKSLPAFPQAASSNHDANDETLLHETREFWARLQPESLLPVLQTVRFAERRQAHAMSRSCVNMFEISAMLCG